MKLSITITHLLIISALIVFTAAPAFPQNPVWFRVNMKIQARLGNFNPGVDTVTVSSVFNGGLTARLRDGLIADSVFEGIVFFPDSLIWKAIDYKFFFRHRGVEVGESIPNRSFTLLSGGQILPLVWFNNDSLGVKATEVVFSVDMSTYIRNGQFDDATDTLVVRGNFNSWFGNANRLLPTLDPLLYRDTVSLLLSSGAVLEYKYVLVSPGKEEIWESGVNRMATFTGADTFVLETAKPLFVNTALTSQAVDVKFIVDMRPAYRKLKTEGMLLDVWRRDTVQRIETVSLVGSQPTLNGWQWSDVNDKWRLYDDGTNGDMKANDSLFTTIVSFPPRTQKGAEYKYSINRQDNEAGFAKNHLLNINDSFSTQTVQDVFGSQDTLYARYGELVFVSEGIFGLLPLAYSLEQNYPNPFNPRTVIGWQMVDGGWISLRVYDVLGREVVTLIDGYKQAGHYQIEFDGSKLPSGVYFYNLEVSPGGSGRTTERLKAFTKTKRMLLIK